MIYDQREGEEMYCWANVGVNLSLHTLKPRCARQTSEAALEKQNICSMAANDLLTLYTTPVISIVFYLSFCNPTGIAGRHIQYMKAQTQVHFHKCAHNTSSANTEKHPRNDAHMHSDTQQHSSDHTSADGNLSAHQQQCLPCSAASLLLPSPSTASLSHFSMEI